MLANRSLGFKVGTGFALVMTISTVLTFWSYYGIGKSPPRGRKWRPATT